jgi:hypothetical protein
LTVLDFVEDAGQRRQMETDATRDLAKLLFLSARYEEAVPLIQRFCELAETQPNAALRRLLSVHGLAFTVRLEATRGAFSGDFEQAAKEMQVLPQTLDPTPPPPARDSQN